MVFPSWFVKYSLDEVTGFVVDSPVEDCNLQCIVVPQTSPVYRFGIIEDFNRSLSSTLQTLLSNTIVLPKGRFIQNQYVQNVLSS